jgi:hypothetical protein
MDSTFDQRLVYYFKERDQAIKALKGTFTDGDNAFKAELKRLTGGSSVDEIIVAHPFIATGVAVGAGVIASRLVMGGAPSAPAAPSAPQRVVIEIKHSGGETVAAAPAAHGFNPMEWIMKAVAGYETIQNVWQNFQASQESRAPRAEAAAAVSENVPLEV